MTRSDAPFDPVLDALDRAPIGADDMSPEQQAEFAEIEAEYDAGRLQMVAHDDVPAVLEAMARGRAA